MIPGSPAQIFEQRLASLDQEIGELVEQAKRNPAIVAAQDVRSQMLLSFIGQWPEALEKPKLRVVKR